ncbi:hypothetical protein F0231_20185 [Vibrio sp. RE86]|uniref:hypothetical protein n=1 Tax=Vibrio sp. RE86 TaxID=2607605 RepID=UPI001493B0C1|nr:hypothetical protein [Vibrio sp. RE86]NOH82045.1 hypothetical protein [Vibrio sp. RE86]
MSKRKMTSYEQKTLIRLYEEDFKGSFSLVTNLIVVMVGFGLATLSSTAFSPKFNLSVCVALLILCAVLLMYLKYTPRPLLDKQIRALNEKYKDNEKVLNEINSFNIHKGIHTRALLHFSPVLMSILFLGYTSFEHLLRVYPDTITAFTSALVGLCKHLF